MSVTVTYKTTNWIGRIAYYGFMMIMVAYYVYTLVLPDNKKSTKKDNDIIYSKHIS